jgi:ferredoxin
MLLALIAQRGAVLRTAIQKGGMEVHKGMKAKMNSCGGGGQCSSCWVEVLEGDDKLSPKTDAERARGKKKPESYRMACQALVQGECNVIVRSMEKVQ